MTEKRIRTALQRTYINFYAWAEDNNIYSITHPLKGGLWGFVYYSTYQEYLIVIDSSLNKIMQKEIFCHEVEHIIKDCPQKTYIIGLNKQHSEKRTLKNIDKIIKCSIV